MLYCLTSEPRTIILCSWTVWLYNITNLQSSKPVWRNTIFIFSENRVYQSSCCESLGYVTWSNLDEEEQCFKHGRICVCLYFHEYVCMCVCLFAGIFVCNRISVRVKLEVNRTWRDGKRFLLFRSIRRWYANPTHTYLCTKTHIFSYSCLYLVPALSTHTHTHMLVSCMWKPFLRPMLYPLVSISQLQIWKPLVRTVALDTAKCLV